MEKYAVTDEIKEMVEAESGGIKELLQPFLRIPLWIGILLHVFTFKWYSSIGTPNIINESIQSVEVPFRGSFSRHVNCDSPL